MSGLEETETTETSLIFCQSLGKETETKHLVFVACRWRCRAFGLGRTETNCSVSLRDIDTPRKNSTNVPKLYKQYFRL